MTEEKAITASTTSTALPGRALRILVVDDDPLGRSLMEAMLAPHGYQLDFACDGTEALAATETRPYDLVFMDLVLPDINGRDVCRQVRAREAGQRHLPIVAVTAYDQPEQPAELARAGMDDYIFKPYDVRMLIRMIQIYVVGDGSTASGSPEPFQIPAVPVLDVEGPLEDLSNDIDSYQDVLRNFTESLPVRLSSMRRAYEAGDYATLGREAHNLKGISAGLGAAALSQLANRLNKTCASGAYAPAADQLNEVERGMAALREQVQSFLLSIREKPGSAGR